MQQKSKKKTPGSVSIDDWLRIKSLLNEIAVLRYEGATAQVLEWQHNSMNNIFTILENTKHM